MKRLLLPTLFVLTCMPFDARAQNVSTMVALTVSGMAAEDVPAIEAALRKVEGVVQVHVDAKSRKVWVWVGTRPGPVDSKPLIAAIERLADADGRLKAALDASRVRPLGPGDINVKTGPAVGSAIPPFTAVDQHGRQRSFDDLRATKGLVLLFYRSADW